MHNRDIASTFGSPPAPSYAAARQRSRSRMARQASRQSSGVASTSEDEGIASPASSVFNLVNNIVGAGLLSMAWCLKEGTALPGMAAMAFMCGLNIYSFLLLAKCCDYAGTFSYKEMGHQALGFTWGNMVQGCMAFYTTGSCISFIVLTGDFLAGSSGVVAYWLPNSVLTNRLLLMGIVTVVIVIPLSSFKQLDKLRYTSFFSFFGILFSLAFVVYEYHKRVGEDGIHPVGVQLAEPRFGLFSAIPILNVAFCAAYNGPRYYQELRNRSMARFSGVVVAALMFCFLVYGSMAVTGYLTFGKVTLSDILVNYGPRNQFALVTRFVLTFVVIFTYPLSFHSLRLSVLTLLGSTSLSKETVNSTWFYVTVCGILVALTVVPGALVTNVGVVLDYKGAIFGSSIIYIFPGLMYIQLKRQEEGLRNAEATTPLLAGRGRAASQGSANAPRTASRKPVGAATEKSRLLEEGHAAANGVSVEDAMPPLSPLWQVSHIGPMVLIASGVVFMLMGVSVTTLKLVGALPQD